MSVGPLGYRDGGRAGEGRDDRGGYGHGRVKGQSHFRESFCPKKVLVCYIHYNILELSTFT